MSSRPRVLTLFGLCLAASAAPLAAQNMALVDFGPTATTSPTNGLYWNNFTNTGAALTNLVTTNNAASGWSLSLTTAGGLNTGAWVPVTTTNLGVFNVPTAATDGLFLLPADGVRTVRLAGLATNRTYSLGIFAGRDATETRSTLYAIRGAATNTNTLVTSGTGLGGAGTNYNNTNFLVFTNLAPDTNGFLFVDYSVASGGFGYLNALYLAENAAGTNTNAVGQEILIDFGVTNNQTTNAASGKVWNNFTAGTATNLLDTRGTNTGYQFSFVTAAAVNSDPSIQPSPALGVLAETNAVTDWLFVTNDPSGHTFKIAGLSRTNPYTFRLYGARSSTETRTTTYTVTGTNSATGSLNTSGSGIGGTGTNYNSTNVLTLSNIFPDRNGEITVNYRVTAGGFGYLNALQITTTNFPGPAPVYLATVNRLRDQDLLSPPPTNAVLFFGSSSIRRWESLARMFADYNVIQRGFGGATFQELNQIVGDAVIPYAPRAIVLWAGANDVYAGRSAGQIFAEYTNFVGTVTNALPNTYIFYIGMTRNPGTANDVTATATRTNANAQISSFITSSGDPRLKYIDLPAFFEGLSHTNTDPFATNLTTNDLWNYYVDSLHANAAGYEVWRVNIRGALTNAGLLPDRLTGTNGLAPAAGRRILFDFGPGDTTNGDLTPSPDASGNRWNNWHPIAGGAAVTTGEKVSGLVDTTGASTGVALTVTGGFQANGKQNGGLTNTPSPSLGNLAVVTATADFFFSAADGKPGGGSDDSPAGFMLSGLDPNLLYDLRFFGSRTATNTRQTSFAVAGANTNTVVLQTSGTGLGANGYTGNDSNVAVAAGMRPNAFGDLFVDVSAIQQSTNSGDANTVSYLNAMEVIAVTPYAGWARSRGLTPGLNDAPSFINGGAGRPNAYHFAFDTDPLDPGDDGSRQVSGLLPDNGGRHLSLTMLMRRGAVLTGQPPTSAPVDGIIYRVLGSSEWGGSNIPVEEVPVTGAGSLPQPGDHDRDGTADYEYRTFRLVQPVSGLLRGFLRVEAAAVSGP